MEAQTKYDSTADTTEHIKRVRELVYDSADNLDHRALVHDKSKLQEPEKTAFDSMTTRLKDLTYGSEEYRATLREFKPAIQHHYENNSHHPEFYPNGINGMSLLDLVEMICDWKAAGERHSNSNILKSIEINKARFGISDQLVDILINTAREFNWLPKEDQSAAPSPLSHPSHRVDPAS